MTASRGVPAPVSSGPLSPTLTHTSTGEGVRANVRSLIASDVPCPRCHAAPGVRCTSVRGLSHHAREFAVNAQRPCSGCGRARVECGCLL